MRNWMVIILAAAILSLFGCGNLDQKQTKTSDFTIKAGDKTVSLMTWDTEINLEEVFGKPLDIKIHQLGQGSDTFEGSYKKEVKFPGIEIELFSPKDNGKSFYILSMKLFDNRYEMVSGIKVGDKLELLKEFYPELMPILDGRNDDNNRGYKIEEGAYNYITFEIKNGEIIEIRVFHEFA